MRLCKASSGGWPLSLSESVESGLLELAPVLSHHARRDVGGRALRLDSGSGRKLEVRTGSRLAGT